MSKQNRQTGINAAAWFYRQSFAGRIETKACVQCKTNRARYDSIYCSEACKRKFLSLESWNERREAK